MVRRLPLEQKIPGSSPGSPGKIKRSLDASNTTNFNGYRSEGISR